MRQTADDPLVDSKVLAIQTKVRVASSPEMPGCSDAALS
jgi:hypothetical protein